MHRRRFIQTLAGVLIAAGPSSMKYSRASRRPILMGVFPRRNVKHTYSAFTPMTRYLEKVLGRPVKLVAVREFSQFWEDVQRRRFDIVHYNQYHYLVSRQLYGYEVILKNQEFGEDSFAGALFVRSDSNIKEITDLKSKAVLFGGGKRAMLSYIVPTWIMRNAGLDDGDYEEQIALNPPNAVISTYHGQADAAGAGESIMQLDIVNKNIDVNVMETLVRSEKVSHLPWAVRDDMDSEMRQLIQDSLVNLAKEEQGKSILKAAKLTAMTPADDSDYELSEKIITELYGVDYARNDA